MVYEKLVDFLSNQLGIDPSEIRPESNVIEDLGADSLDLVEMLTEMESDLYGIYFRLIIYLHCCVFSIFSCTFKFFTYTTNCCRF